MPAVIDAHQHFWRLDAQEQPWRDDRHGSIARDYGPQDLAGELTAAGVEATVLMQSVDEPAENDRLAAYAAAAPYVAGVVAWLPLHDAAAARAELARIQQLMPLLRGVRCLVGRDPLPWLAEPASRELFAELAAAGLSWDVVPVTSQQVESVLDLARAVPELRVVVDHLGRPPVDTAGWQPWADHLRELSTCPGIALKVSVGIDVLTAWSSWSGNELVRYVAWAAECFGADRLMLSSNWPVVLLQTSYERAWSDLRAATALAVSPAGLPDVLGGTAARWYRLDVPAPPPTSSS